MSCLIDLERIFPFIQHNGPNHVFQVIRSNPENVNVMRCATSLLVVTISLLQQKGGSEEATKTVQAPERKSSMNLISENLSVWVNIHHL